MNIANEKYKNEDGVVERGFSLTGGHTHFPGDRERVFDGLERGILRDSQPLPPSAFQYNWYAEGECILSEKAPASAINRWRVEFGLHNGSHQVGPAVHHLHNLQSYAACAEQMKRSLTLIRGVQSAYVAFANAIAPDGTVHKLLDGAPRLS